MFLVISDDLTNEFSNKLKNFGFYKSDRLYSSIYLYIVHKNKNLLPKLDINMKHQSTNILQSFITSLV